MRSEQPLRSWFAGNLAWLAGILLFVLISVRLLRVSRLDLTTAGAIIQHAGTQAIVATILISSLPVVLTVLGITSAAAASHPTMAPRLCALSWVGYVVIFTIAVFSVPWISTAAILLAGPVMLVASVVGRRTVDQLSVGGGRGRSSGGIWPPTVGRSVRAIAARHDSSDLATLRRIDESFRSAVEELEAQSGATREDIDARATKLAELKKLLRQADEPLARLQARKASVDAKLVFWAAAVAAPSLVSVLSSRPWLPAEDLTTDKGAHVVGYVIDDGGEWVSVLTEKDRSIKRFGRGEIIGRSACRLGVDRTGRTLWELITDAEPGPGYPACP